VKKVFEIPIAARTAKGRAIVNFVGMEPGEKVAAIVEVPKIEEGKFIATITKRGQIKKTEVTEYENFRQKGIIGVKIEGDDQLLSAALTDGQREFLIATKMGQSIRFQEDQVRAMGRGTVGVKAIDVADDDQVVGMAVTEEARQHVLAVCDKGYGKRTLLEEFRQQHRGGRGIILIDASDRNGPVVDLKLVKDSDEIMLITDKGQTIRTKVAEIRETGRNAQGVKIMSVEGDERIVALERLVETPPEVGGGASETPPCDGGPDESGGGADAGGAPPSDAPPPGDGEVN
jgi:DNA gyrase subunit A